MKKLLLVLNPCAGKKRANQVLPEIIRMINAKGYECSVYVTACSTDATVYTAQHAAEYDRIICIGGDGTLNETVSGVIQGNAHCPIGYIPAGSTNDFAYSLGMSSDILKAAEDALGDCVYEFDTGMLNGRRFIYTASCGAFARTSYSTPQSFKNVFGRLAYLLEGIRDLPSVKPIHMKVTSGDTVYDGEYLFASVTNSLSVGGILKLNPDMVGLNDGVFETILVKNPQNPAQFTQILTALSTCKLPCDMIEFFESAKLTFDMDESIEWTTDGERGEEGTHFEIENLTRIVKLVLPQRAQGVVPVEASIENELQD